MNKFHPFFKLLWFGSNIALLASIVFLLFSAGWEYSTRQYLRGFVEAVTPLNAPAVDKITAILNWMDHGPARANASDFQELAARDPRQTLEYTQLLRICGTATNAFVNLANTSGVPARRLLLLDSNRRAKHVSAEVLLDGRWVVVDPLYRRFMLDPNGRHLTREDLQDPAVLVQAARNLPGYDLNYSYASTSHVRLSAVPVVGQMARRVLDRYLPGWEGSVYWTLLLERESFAAVIIGALLAVFFLLLRLIVRRYGEKRLGQRLFRVHTQLFRAGRTFFGSQA